MAVTGTSVAAAATMLAAAAAIFITFVLCFYLFLCAKRYRGAAPTIGGDGRARTRFVFAGASGCHGGGDGMDESAILALPRKEVAPGDPAADCAVCITELAPGEAARVLPRCGHGFHVECVDMWLRSHSTCPLCRCAVVDEEKVVGPPEADPESPVFPTNVLFFGSQDTVSTRGAAAAAAGRPPPLSPLSREPPRTAAATQAPQPAAGPMSRGRRGGGPSGRPAPAARLPRRDAVPVDAAATAAAARRPRLGGRPRRRREQRVATGEAAVRFLTLFCCILFLLIQSSPSQANFRHQREASVQ